MPVMAILSKASDREIDLFPCPAPPPALDRKFWEVSENLETEPGKFTETGYLSFGPPKASPWWICPKETCSPISPAQAPLINWPCSKIVDSSSSRPLGLSIPFAATKRLPALKVSIALRKEASSSEPAAKSRSREQIASIFEVFRDLTLRPALAPVTTVSPGLAPRICSGIQGSTPRFRRFLLKQDRSSPFVGRQHPILRL